MFENIRWNILLHLSVINIPFLLLHLEIISVQQFPGLLLVLCYVAAVLFLVLWAIDMALILFHD